MYSWALILVLSLLSPSLSHATDLSTDDRIHGAFFGALIADALCLGSHYEYDAPKIHEAYNGSITRYMAPGEHMGGATHGVGWGQRNYHPGTVAGDQTDYGEYNVLVLEHVAATGDFQLDSFLPRWQARLTSGWKQWVCTQTKQTYQQVQQGMSHDQLGGNSNAMALRFASIFALKKSEEETVQLCLRTMFTHRERTAKLGNEFVCRVVYRIIFHSETLKAAVDAVATQSDPWIQQKVKQAKDKVKEATDSAQPLSSERFVDDLALTSMARLWDVGKSEPIKVGKASPTEGTLPGTLYFVLKYDNAMDAYIANSMVGGDNASRAVAIGMILGAAYGVQGVPDQFRSGLNHWEHCESLLDQVLKGSKDEL